MFHDFHRFPSHIHHIVSPGWLLPPWSQPCLCCTNSCGPSRDPSVAAAIRISRAPWIRDSEVESEVEVCAGNQLVN